MNSNFSKIDIFFINLDHKGSIVLAQDDTLSQLDTFLGKKFIDLIHDQDKKTIKKPFFNIINHITEKETFELRLQVSNEFVWFKAICKNENGLIQVTLVNVDSIKKELATSDSVQNLMLDVSSKLKTVFFQYDVIRDKFIFINNQVFSILNVSSEDVMTSSDLLFESFKVENVKSKIIHSFHNNLDYVDLFKIKKDDGEFKYIKLSAYKSDYYDLDNSILNGSVIDISEQEALKEQLILSRNTTDSISKNRFGFLAKSSHEIRTPLHGIIGAVELLKLKAKGTPDKMLDIIESSSTSLLTIINDILDFSKIDSGKMELFASSFDFKNVIDDSVSLIKSACDKKSISIIVKNDLQSKYIGDAGRLKQILINFLSNALKFSPSETSIVLSFYEKEGKVFFSVKDFGRGISATNQAKLFQFFSQIGNNEGSGLGLSICKSLSQMMGGDIGVISEEGQGSEFWVLLPLEKSIETQSSETSGVKESLLDLANFKFLVSEDNEVNLAILKQMFESLGITPDFATNGEEAYKLAQENKYDMIFMDCQMPIMDGLQSTRLIRKKSLNQKTPVIALTAHAFDDYKEKCFFAGMTGFLSKPLKISQLKSMIQMYIPLELSNPEYNSDSDDLMSLFRKNLHRDLQDILINFQQGRFGDVSIKAHGMKSASLWVELKELSELFKGLEFASKNDQFMESQDYIKKIRLQIEKDSL